jgi:hypothetical protein
MSGSVLPFAIERNKMAQATATRRYISAWVERSFADRFEALARENERSASAEARIALRQHLERAPVNTVLAADAAEKPAVVGTAGVGAAGASHSLDARGRSSARSAGRAHEHGPGHDDAAD